MENQAVKIAIYQPDGNVCIMHYLTKARLQPDNHALDHWTPSEGEDGWFVREASEKNITEEIDRSRIEFDSFEIITMGDIPEDKTFRDAWTKCPVNKIRVDMDKARVIHTRMINEVLYHDDLRQLVMQMGLADRLSNSEKLADLEKQKDALLNTPLTADLSVAATPDELRVIWPEEFK